MNDSKKSAWDSYRRWRKITWFFVPVWLCFVTIEAKWPVFGIALIFFVLYGIKTQWFECPKCEECFFIYPKFPRLYWPFAKKCMNCGFPKWEEPPPKPARVEIYPIPRDENPRADPVAVKRLRLAEFLTLVLRDDPQALGLRLDGDGWANADKLLTRANRYAIKLTREDLNQVLTISGNHRFDWDPSGNRIRARR